MSESENTAYEETEEKIAVAEDDNAMSTSVDTLVIESVPQCVNCPYNEGAVACAIFGEKPSEYVFNEKDCPRE